MDVLVCGSRTFDRIDTVYEVLQGVYDLHSLGHLLTHVQDLTIIAGEARGADKLAKDWATVPGPHPADTDPDNGDICHVWYHGFPADWYTHHPDWCPGAWCQRRNYCVGAGPRRNQKMLDEGHPDRVIAFIDKELLESRGTLDMVTRAENAGLPVMIVQVSTPDE